MLQPDKGKPELSGRAGAQFAQNRDRIERLNTLGRLMEANEKKLIKEGLDFGRDLCHMKRDVGHGNWKPLFKNGVFEFHVRTAQRYMRLYRKSKELNDDGDKPQKMTVTKALNLLAEPASTTDEPADEEGVSKPIEEGQAISDAEIVPKSSANVVTDDPTEAAESEIEPQPTGAGSKPPKRPATSKAGAGDGWRTPDYIVEPVLELFGSIDLDPAADMDKHIPAKIHFTAEDDGLHPGRVWQGKVFLNPPSDGELAGRFVRKLINEHKGGRVEEAVVLLEAKTDAKWFRQLRPHIRAFLAKPEFVQYPGVPDALVAIYLGSREARFCQVFGSIGDIYTLYRPVE